MNAGQYREGTSPINRMRKNGTDHSHDYAAIRPAIMEVIDVITDASGIESARDD